ncbi:MAG: hypothetical protein JSS67_04325 [Bacteroidetes bacterium]|nr:hypothetical protein [Bacteroidota bacterium]
MQKYLFFILFLVPAAMGFAQSKDSLLMHDIIRDIASMQVSKDGEFYAGMFPTFRECGGAPHNYQPDNNVFFTAITAFSFRNMLPYLNEGDQPIATQIVQNIKPVYPYYKNKNNEPFYNFWPTFSPIMPHTYYFKYLKNVFGQGEDADDSVMILMTDDSSDSTAERLKKRLIEASNLFKPSRKIISTYKNYRNIPAYSTYLGLRMTPDFDFAVHCNILYFMYQKKLLWGKQDSATLSLVEQMVHNRDYMKTPVFLSPYYVKSTILIYHLARLMGAFHIPELEKYKPQIIADAKSLLPQCTNIMDQIILRTSLLRLGDDAPPLDIPSISAFEQSNQQQYVFFQARAAFSYPVLLKQIFLHWSYIYYYFYCPAYNKTLWLEYLVERNKRDQVLKMGKQASVSTEKNDSIGE